MSISDKDFMSPEELNAFASDYLGLNSCDSDLYYETYYKMDTEQNYYEEQFAREELENITYWFEGRVFDIFPFLCYGCKWHSERTQCMNTSRRHQYKSKTYYIFWGIMSLSVVAMMGGVIYSNLTLASSQDNMARQVRSYLLIKPFPLLCRNQIQWKF